MGLRSVLVVDPARLESLRSEWDALAVACDEPYGAPAWVLAWWRHVAPEGALLRVAAAFDGERLVGIAPFWAERRKAAPARYRPLAAKTSEPLEPLAAPGRAEEVAAACAEALARASPRPSLLQFDRVRAGSPWPDLFSSQWPGGRAPAVRRTHLTPAPAVRLEHADLDAWLATKGRNFRQQMRRSLRRVEQRGGSFRLSTQESLARDMEAFVRLHNARWAHRGGSGALGEGVLEMLLQAGRELVGLARFRLWCLDMAGETLSAHLFIGAGDELAYWLGGFDERLAKEHPGVITLVVAVEDALARGERRLDLGPGGQSYKYRLADSEETLQLVSLVPPTPLEPVVRSELTARRLARRLRRGRGPEAQAG